MNYFVLMALFLFTPHAFAKEARPDLTIVQGETKRVLTENDLRQLHIDSVVVQDPVYNRHKRYAGYWLSDIFHLMGIRPDPKTVWTFTALDGYKASISVADVLQYGVKAFVAVADLDKEEGWENIKQGKEWISPGPYYLVWQTPLRDVTPRVKLPWPYQMIEISIIPALAVEMKPGYRSRRPTWWSARNVSLRFESVSSGWVCSRRRWINQQSMRAYRGQWRHRSSRAAVRPPSWPRPATKSTHGRLALEATRPLNSTAEAGIFGYTRYRNSRA